MNEAQALEKLGERFDVWLSLENAMRADVMALASLLNNDEQDQVLRRALIRALWAFIEGTVSSLDGIIDVSWAIDPSLAKGNSRRSRAALDRTKRALRDVAGLMCPGWSPSFGDEGWRAVRDNNTVRDRLMHPKQASDLLVSDAELATARCAARWFIGTIVQIQLRMMRRASGGIRLPDELPNN
jgi:hypothetical protein